MAGRRTTTAETPVAIKTEDDRIQPSASTSGRQRPPSFPASSGAASSSGFRPKEPKIKTTTLQLINSADQERLQWSVPAMSESEKKRFVFTAFGRMAASFKSVALTYYLLFKGSNDTAVSSVFNNSKLTKTGYSYRKERDAEEEKVIASGGTFDEKNFIEELKKQLEIFARNSVSAKSVELKRAVVPFKSFESDILYYKPTVDDISIELNPRWYMNIYNGNRQISVSVFRTMTTRILGWIQYARTHDVSTLDDEGDDAFLSSFIGSINNESADAQNVRQLHTQIVANLEKYPDVFSVLNTAVVNPGEKNTVQAIGLLLRLSEAMFELCKSTMAIFYDILGIYIENAIESGEPRLNTQSARDDGFARSIFEERKAVPVDLSKMFLGGAPPQFHEDKVNAIQKAFGFIEDFDRRYENATNTSAHALIEKSFEVLVAGATSYSTASEKIFNKKTYDISKAPTLIEKVRIYLAVDLIKNRIYRNLVAAISSSAPKLDVVKSAMVELMLNYFNVSTVEQFSNELKTVVHERYHMTAIDQARIVYYLKASQVDLPKSSAASSRK